MTGETQPGAAFKVHVMKLLRAFAILLIYAGLFSFGVLAPRLFESLKSTTEGVATACMDTDSTKCCSIGP
jgi:hypothetical protein